MGTVKRGGENDQGFVRLENFGFDPLVADIVLRVFTLSLSLFYLFLFASLSSST